MSGPTGLRYEAAYPLLDRYFPGDAWEDAFADLRELERTALSTMHEKD